MPPILLHPPKPRKVARSFYRRWTWRRQLAASGLRLSVLACIALLGWGGWYLANKGFSRQWRTKVVEELRKRGIDASVRRLTLDPFRGLVAQDVRIFDSKNGGKPLAVISEIALDINYAALLHRQPFLNAIEIRRADLTFPNPGGDPNAPKARLTQFRAHVYFPPEQIFISQADGIFCGIRVSATGQLIKRADFKPARVVSDEEWQERMALVQRVAAALGRFSFAGGPPSLQLKFTGDVAEMENAHIEASLSGERVQRGAYEIKAFSAAAEWSEGKLNLRQLEWTDAAGVFSSRASWSGLTKAATYQARSSINAQQFLDAFGFGKPLADATFTAAPQIELSGSANFSTATPQLSVLGRIGVENFTYKTVPFLNLTADFSWDGERTMLREIKVRHESGELLADFLDAPGDFRLNLESSINPAALRSLVPEGSREFLGEWQWPRSPSVRLSLRGTSREPESWKGDGSVALQRARFRGVWLNSATARLRFADGALTFDDLHVVRDEGVGTGSFTYDPIKHEVRIDNVKTTLRPTDAMSWIEPKLLKVVTPYKFHSPPTLTANGLVQYRGGKNTRLTINIEAPAGLDYVFLGKTLSFDRARGHLLITDDRVQLSDVDGTLFGGTVRGTADISTAKNDPHYTATVALDGVDFPRLTDLYFKFETAHGQLFGSYDFQGVGDDAKTMRGVGKIKVANGDVFAIPVFGPLSGLISAIIPGAGYSVAKQATASFTIKEGVIRTDDFKVSGKLFGMVGHGDIHFLENRLDFDIRINAGGPAVLLTPVYKLFEYKGEGSLSKPNWHPKRF
ncbi:MAG: AsmA-like C-terminal region-containing protein [Verrucomicrobiota bacterium]|nr:AsmA-like C-terminal region-containing protein [Verrucomicrobiota bacterium]